MSGVEVCRQARQWSAVPIIMLTVDDQPESKVVALNAGADDYVTKPFHMSELEARIRAVTRRRGTNPSEPVLAFAEYKLDVPRRQLQRGEEIIHLTRTEFELLKTLVSYSGRVLTFDFLLNAVWGPSYDDIRSVHVHISKLRRKIEISAEASQRLIHSVPGVGYRFEFDRQGSPLES
jgi:two-component system response regulator RegX3